MRKSTEIDRGELQREISLLENSNQFVRRSEIYEPLAQTVWSKSLRSKPLSAAFFYQKVIQFEKMGCPILFKTAVGKKGNSNLGKGPRVKTDRKKKGLSQEAKEYHEKNYKGMEGSITKAVNGSLSGAIRLKCLDCSCGSRKDVSECVVKSCAIWGFRPWRKDV